MLSLRACSHLQHQQAILRPLARILWVSGLVVRLVWVPSEQEPMKPMSRVSSDYQGLQARAKVRAWHVWQLFLDNPDQCQVRGVLCLRDC